MHWFKFTVWHLFIRVSVHRWPPLWTNGIEGVNCEVCAINNTRVVFADAESNHLVVRLPTECSGIFKDVIFGHEFSYSRSCKLFSSFGYSLRASCGFNITMFNLKTGFVLSLLLTEEGQTRSVLAFSCFFFFFKTWFLHCFWQANYCYIQE